MPEKSFTPQYRAAHQGTDTSSRIANPPMDQNVSLSLTSFLMDRARSARKTSAALRFAKDLAGAVASAATSENPSEHIAAAARIGNAIGSRCATTLLERGAVPDWMTVDTLKSQISSLMWPAASEGLRLGKPPQVLEGALTDVFLSMVDNSPSDLKDPPYARLPEGIAVALSEQKNMAEKIIPQILLMERDKNCRFYVGNSLEFTSWVFQNIRKSTKELAAVIEPTEGGNDEQRVIIYQSIFGSTSSLAAAAMRLAAHQVYSEIKVGISNGVKPRVSETQRNYAQAVKSHLEDGVSMLRNAFSKEHPTSTEAITPSNLSGEIAA